MAIEALPEEYIKQFEEEKKKKENTITGCSMRLEDDKFIVTIPEFGKDLIFSKRELRGIFEQLYTS